MQSVHMIRRELTTPLAVGYNIGEVSEMLTKRKKVRKYIRFYGQVQAVGFRWRTMQAAQLYGATGWVRNEYDDSVSMEIQGTERQIDDVIAALDRGSYIVIERMEVKQLEPVEDENGFRVKYH
ncbi:acylphosphatase [Ruminococcus difficilis]